MLTPTRILVPVDFSPNGEQALDYAIELARKLDASVQLLHVVGIPSLGVPELGVAVASATIESEVRDGQVGLERLVASREGQARFASPILRTGDAQHVIVHTAIETGADLIVMGTHGRRGLSRALLGSVAELVVRTSPVPVLTIRGHHR
jgi:nucleotide-binding universal stress UspA family protein